MLLYMIRHGAPDYGTDTLLPEGKVQAELLSHRLAESGIDEIHCSPQGRAQETAEPTAKLLNLPIITEPWAYELNLESKTAFPDGQLKTISCLTTPYLHSPDFRGLSIEEGLAQIPGLCETGFPGRYRELSEGLDDLLSRLGYDRNEQGFYDVREGNDRHVALFCHCGNCRVMLSHLLHIPYQFFGATLMKGFTGVTVLHFGTDRKAVCPELISYGDVGHLYGVGNPPTHPMFKIPY